MTEAKRRLKVFLCHAHSDAATVHDVFHFLKMQGVDAWLDKEKLLPGADWDLEIRKAVRASDVVVICLSKKFNEAGYRQKEVYIALDAAMFQPQGEIFIIPTRLEVCDVPENLSKWHRVDLFEDDGRQKLIYALRARADSIGASMPPLPDAVSATHSGIWMDHHQNVWRDMMNLGPLPYPDETKLLAYMIDHKDKSCHIGELFEAVVGPDWELLNLRGVEYAINDIRKHIEEDVNNPTYLVGNFVEGYTLKS
jgi:hypothetical protein